MDEPCFYGFPTYGEAGPEGGPGLRRPCRSSRPTGRSSGTRPPSRGWRRSWRAICPGRWARRSTPRPASTRSRPDRDFVVDRLPEAPGVIVAHSGRRTASSSPRSSAGSWPSCCVDGVDPIGRRSRAIPDRSTDPARGRPRDVLDGLTASWRTVRVGVCAETSFCATVPQVRAGEGPTRRRLRMRQILACPGGRTLSSPCCGDLGAVAGGRGHRVRPPIH